jgi:hypothetical protein
MGWVYTLHHPRKFSTTTDQLTTQFYYSLKIKPIWLIPTLNKSNWIETIHSWFLARKTDENSDHNH